MTISEFLTNFADLLDVRVSSISATTELRTVQEWDSLALLAFIAFVDSNFSTVIKIAELEDCVTVEDLYKKFVSKNDGIC